MNSDAVKIRLRYLSSDVDRHGNARFYVRLAGRRKVRIRGIPGSDEFMAGYSAAIEGRAQVTQGNAAPGSFRHLCQLYFGSAEFRALDLSTQAWRRRALDLIAEKCGDLPVSRMEERHVRRIVEERADKPSAAKKRLRAMQAMFKWAVAHNEIGRNPARDVAPIRYVEKGHHTWTLEEVEAFESKHPLGTKARLALSILLYTACRREDVPRLGPQHVRGNRVRFTQGKNEHRNPVHIDIPLHPDLAAAIDAAPSGHLTFIVTTFGKPFTTNGFGNWFRDRCDEAGLHRCSAHGLRKATAARLAEHGATPHEIMAITGHRSLQEVERYTREARRVGLADSAMAKLKR
jgi:integrase/recombinase XerD